MSYETISIRGVIEMIGSNQLYLPAIQRKFIWKPEQIEKLFDSIMRDYPIGTFLFWFLKGERINDYTFYKFLKDYHQRDDYLNKIAPKPELKDQIIGVLDGQQRLSSMYIALQGTYAYKLPYYSPSSDWAYPSKKFYLNLININQSSETGDCIFDFQFLKEEEANKFDESNLWFLVKNVLKWKKASEGKTFYREVERKYRDSELIELLKSKKDNIDDTLTDLWHKLTKTEIINYYKIDEQELDNILDIFVRVNSGGTILSKSDLLFSTIVANWEEGREEIENFLKRINEKGFYFDNDFIMRSCLVLTDCPVLFKVGNFKQENIIKIKNEWQYIESAISKMVDILVEFGFSGETIPSQNALIPIAYYFIKDGMLNLEIKKELRRFIIHSFLKQIYGGQGDRVLSTIRETLREESGEGFFTLKKKNFSFEDFIDMKLPNDKALRISDNDLDEILEYKKGSYTFMVLSLLYPSLKYDQIKFHQDHIHPDSLFTDPKLKKHGIENDKWGKYKELKDRLPNLQFLESRENESKNKMSFNEWFENIDINERDKYKKDNFIPGDVGFEFTEFESFYTKRKNILRKELEKLFSTK